MERDTCDPWIVQETNVGKDLSRGFVAFHTQTQNRSVELRNFPNRTPAPGYGLKGNGPNRIGLFP